ncbi:hypothetical protein OTU49_008822, partial [Cherax quadricarinatus]
MRSHIHGVRSGQSMVALLTTLSPLAVSLLLWVSQSVAQENISNAINNNSSATTVSLGQRDNASVNNSDVKPVIYVDNPQHLRELQEQSFLRHSLRLSPGRSTDGKDGNVLGVSLLEQAATLGSQLRHIANNELGVTHMQATFDELPY